MTVADVKALGGANELLALSYDVRERILYAVSQNGGHLASSLGAVELAIALVRAFDPETDRVLWDVGHQSYAWKILTGRSGRFGTLRRFGGISGFPNPEESVCDAFVAGHAGAALAAAEGLAVARDRRGGTEHVVAVVGDAAFSNGMALEALNNCRALTKRLILVVNDNESATTECPIDLLLEAFRFKSLGWVEGHDVKALEEAFEKAKAADGLVALRVTTRKGMGFWPAECNPMAWHGVAPFDLSAYKDLNVFKAFNDLKESKNSKDSKDPKDLKDSKVLEDSKDLKGFSDRSWSEIFGSAVCAAARRDPKVCALTAAMREGTGLAPFSHEFPDRFFDVGICEEHLVTFAGGLAKGGMKPVAAVYSTFLQRAIDQVMHDVCLMNLPVIFGIDRAGAVGADGRTHHGMFDIPMLRCLPNLSILQPKDANELEAMVELALARNAPVAIRYPRGRPAQFNDPKDVKDLKWGCAEQLSNPGAALQIWALGDQVAKALKVAELLTARGIEAGVVNARFVKPFDADLLMRQRTAGARIVSLENGAVAGGFGEAIGADVRFGWPDAYVTHGSISDLEFAYGLTPAAIAEEISQSPNHTISQS